METGPVKNIMVLYMLAPDSEVNKRDRHNEHAEKELERILACVRGQSVMILADANARFGNYASVLANPDEDKDEETEARIYNRASEDEEESKRGRELVDMLSAQGIVVANGINGVEMKYSFEAKGRGGRSVPDFIAMSEELIDEKTCVKVAANSDWRVGSDHKLIYAETHGEVAEEEEEEVRSGATWLP